MTQTAEERRAARRESRRKWQEKNPDYARNWAESHKEQRRNSCRKYRESHREQVLATQRKCEKAHPELRLKQRYGIIDGGRQLLLEQGGVCAICGDARSNESLEVDHNHVTGHVRGWLCHRCNVGVGCFKDNPEMLHKAAEYLEETGISTG
jgi:hypothetical protein